MTARNIYKITYTNGCTAFAYAHALDEAKMKACDQTR